MAFVSAASFSWRRGPVGVDVVDRLGAARRRPPARPAMAWMAPSPSGCGRGDVVRVGGRAVPGDLGVDPRAAGHRPLGLLQDQRRRRPRTGRTRRAPCRTAGWRARGSGLRVRACICANAETHSGSTEASVPPAMHTSARPSRIYRNASPTAWAPAAQAVVMQVVRPGEPERHGHVPGRGVRHELRDHERAHPVGAPCPGTPRAA